MCLFRYPVGNLRANFNFGFGRPIILPFRLPQQQSILAALEFKRILPASGWNLNLSLPHLLRYKISFLVEQGSVSIQNLDRSVRQPSVGIEGDRQHVGLSFHMNHPVKIRTGNPTRTPDRYPVLRESDGLPRFEECVGLLISEEACLQLGIGTIVVGEGLAPIKAIRVNTPGPYFPSG